MSFSKQIFCVFMLILAVSLWVSPVYAGKVPCVFDAAEFIGKDTAEVFSAMGDPSARYFCFGDKDYSWKEKYELDNFKITLFFDSDRRVQLIKVRFPVLIESSELAKQLVGCAKMTKEISLVKETTLAGEGFGEICIKAKQ